MWTDQFGSYLMLLAMAALLRSSFELQRPSSAPRIIALPSLLSGTEEEWAVKRKEWSRKAVEGYARAQEKKWRNWDEIMFEAKLT